jgi:hypothetical protein
LIFARECAACGDRTLIENDLRATSRNFGLKVGTIDGTDVSMETKCEASLI